MNKKRFWLLALIFTLSLSLFACGDSAEKEEAPSTIAEETEKEDSEKVQEEEEEDTEKDEVSSLSDDSNEIFEGKVNLYFANAEYVNTGNEDLNKLLVEEKEIISDQEDLEMTLINELMEGPSSEDSMYNLIPESVKIIDIENTDGIVYVNFSSDNLNGGSMEEKFIVQQIVNTLLDLETSNEIVFLIDGEAAESLMGHIDVTGGFTEKFE